MLFSIRCVQLMVTRFFFSKYRGTFQLLSKLQFEKKFILMLKYNKTTIFMKFRSYLCSQLVFFEEYTLLRKYLLYLLLQILGKSGQSYLRIQCQYQVLISEASTQRSWKKVFSPLLDRQRLMRTNFCNSGQRIIV